MADISFQGNTTADPELKFVPSGQAVLNFSVAENHRKNNNGEWVDDGTTFYRVAVWGPKAETLADHMRKGDRVLVVGRFRGGEFDGKNGPVKTYEVTANYVGVVPKRDQGQQSHQGGGYQQAPPQQGQPSYSPAQQAGGWGQPPQGQPWDAPQADERPF